MLAQFPSSFHNTKPKTWITSSSFGDRLHDVPIVVEFRDAQWLNDETFAFLRDTNLGFCCVDEPDLKGLLPPIAEATSKVAYVRFHGRNAAKWWQHEQAYERYDYTYPKEELDEWTPKIQKLNQRRKSCLSFRAIIRLSARKACALSVNRGAARIIALVFLLLFFIWNFLNPCEIESVGTTTV